MRRYFLHLIAGTMFLLAACNPVYNWREVNLPQAGLKVLLPCKPDQGQRAISLAGLTVEMQMAGCEAGAGLFVVAYVDLGETGKVEAALEQWKAAMLGNMQANDVALQSAVMIKGASTKPAPIRLNAVGRRQDGSAVAAQAIWFAKGAHLYHAVVYADKLSRDAVDAFFSGIEFQ
jgi:hypothetical protein